MEKGKVLEDMHSRTWKLESGEGLDRNVRDVCRKLSFLWWKRRVSEKNVQESNIGEVGSNVESEDDRHIGLSNLESTLFLRPSRPQSS